VVGLGKRERGRKCVVMQQQISRNAKPRVDSRTGKNSRISKYSRNYFLLESNGIEYKKSNANIEKFHIE
jgi:hypothetical protein